MWHSSVAASQLVGARSWKIEQFRPRPRPYLALGHGLTVPLGEVVVERKESVDPSELPYRDLTYIGLESIEPGTGAILNSATALEQEIRSRSKAFESGDILYARLRSYLNKVFLVGAEFTRGSCSGEFYVLIPDRSRVVPEFLCWQLSTPEMVNYVTHRLSGATHPRLSLEDLFAYPVAVPPLDQQEKAAEVIRAAYERRRAIRRELDDIPARTAEQIKQILGAT